MNNASTSLSYGSIIPLDTQQNGRVVPMYERMVCVCVSACYPLAQSPPPTHTLTLTLTHGWLQK